MAYVFSYKIYEKTYAHLVVYAIRSYFLSQNLHDI